MPSVLTNRWMRWSLEPASGRWSLSPLISRGPNIVNASMGLSWSAGLARSAWPSLVRGADIGPYSSDRVLGHDAQALRLQCLSAHQPLEAQVDVALLSDLPLLLLRMNLRLTGEHPVRLNRLGFVSTGFAHPRGTRQEWEPPASESSGSLLEIAGDGRKARFFTNGWQSWSFAGSLGVDDRQPQTRLSLLSRPIFYNPSTGRPAAPGHFVSDMFGAVLDPSERSGLLAGFVTQQQAFGSLETYIDSAAPGLRMWASGDGFLLRPGESFETDWAAIGWLSLDDLEPLSAYLDLAGEVAGARVPDVGLTGWSSWYYFFESISRDAFDRNLDWMGQHRASLPLDLAQLDDGFEANVGDWHRFSDRFQDGVKPVSQRIRQADVKPGLWLAPYIAKPRARWVRDHPDWVLRRPGGRPSNAGYNWSTFTVGLDPTHPGVKEAVSELIKTAVEPWGFEFLKLDFLYAAALPGRRHDPSSTRAQAMHQALATIRQAAGEGVWLMGCGCPLGSGIGIFDSMRIGPDVAPRWKPAYQGIELFFQNEPNLPSARNALRLAINRSMLNRKWWLNDPDCLILRGRDTHLSPDEVQAMASVMALTAGSLIDSDDLPSLAPERMAWLARLLPPLPTQAQVHGRFETAMPDLMTLDLESALGAWKLVCLINWDDTQRRVLLEPEVLGMDPSITWAGVDFWREKPLVLEAPPWSFDVPPHGVRLFSLRALDDSTPVWLGDTLHVSQGLIVSEWTTAPGDLRARLAPGHRVTGRIWLAFPGQPSEAVLGATPVVFQPAGESIFTADVAAEADVVLTVRWPDPVGGRGAD